MREHFKLLTKRQKVIVFIVATVFLALIAYITTGEMQKVVLRQKLKNLTEHENQLLSDHEKELRQVAKLYADSLAQMEQKIELRDKKFEALVLQYQEIVNRKQSQNEIVSRFDTTDRLNELGRISTVHGLQ